MSRGRLVGAAVTAVVVLAVAVALSVAFGSRPIPLGTVLGTVLHPGRQDEIGLIVLGNRVPRTVVGLLAGTALGGAGAVMQGVTRNPLADPSVLGINAGAALAVVVGIAVFGISGTAAYLPFAFVGAGLAALLVYGVAALARRGLSPVGLALAGAVVAAALSSITTAVLVTSQSLLDQLRFWQVGALAGKDLGTAAVIAVPVLVGLVVAAGLGRSLNTLALGDELAASLGQRVVLVRVVGGVVTVLLAGSAVAAAGPIAFVGLAVPHAVRRLSGPDQRWTILLSALVAPALLLVADVVGRVVAYPGELQVGIVTALIGAPVFIWLVRSRVVTGL
ncbi:ABC transporter permease [Curtobacterium citreum]|uniref:Iron chelate uptake ABC transporter family permease subunit n=1 Tax=Curtobacterium citreum TaxID=2036 RepID=A0ABT2HJQ0_9MICO|nr:iron chelate uptake ABC transporter family permease subunit [Curtobacterium citreum]MCS6523496.1 iron chelate uptake ABC transporter family permease subunit [Curtobacterium citreum]GGL84743.1 ABC transporter permease [Curtobacterium citreum]